MKKIGGEKNMQSKDRTYQVIAIVALVIGVCALTVGFAAFTTNLTINSSATVRPASTVLDVVFSRQKTAVNEGTITGVPVNNATAGTATLSNLTVSNIHADFTQPGEKVTYTFYVYNNSPFTAYLTNVNFGFASGTDFKVCSAANDGNPANPATDFTAACADITFKLSIEDQTNVTNLTDSANGSTIADSNGIAAGTGKTVTVEIAYPDGSDIADGDFNVAFGDVELTYSSVPVGS